MSQWHIVKSNTLYLSYILYIVTKRKLLDIMLFYYLVIVLCFYILRSWRKLSNTNSCLFNKLVVGGRSLSNN